MTKSIDERFGPKRDKFDKSYYDRFYRHARTRATTRREAEKLAAYVCAYVRYLGQPVRRVLDLGCGLGYWKNVVEEQFPRARYHGVDVSEYLCRKYGWTQGSLTDFTSKRPYDLVVCQDVIQYLSDREAKRAIDNLAALCRGALYLQAPTVNDFVDAVDLDRTDLRVHVRTAKWYRKRLRRHFVNAGAGVFLTNDTELAVFELQKGA